MRICIHNNKKAWTNYLKPKRLTLKEHKPIYRWLNFVFSF